MIAADILFISAGFDAHIYEEGVRGAGIGFGVDGDAFKAVTATLLAALAEDCDDKT